MAFVPLTGSFPRSGDWTPIATPASGFSPAARAQGPGGTPGPAAAPPRAPEETSAAAIARLERELAALRARDAERSREHDEAMAAVRAEQAAVDGAVGRLDAAAKRVEAERATLLGEVRAGLGALVLTAAQRIAGDALAADPALLDALVDEGVRALGREGLVVRVAPDDLERVEARVAGTGVRVVGDSSIEAGCACEGPAGRIDATIATAVAAVRSVLTQWAGA
jgi:flagellar biosynthesis/type III secretory pathway protein FliH